MIKGEKCTRRDGNRISSGRGARPRGLAEARHNLLWGNACCSLQCTSPLHLALHRTPSKASEKFLRQLSASCVAYFTAQLEKRTPPW